MTTDTGEDKLRKDEAVREILKDREKANPDKIDFIADYFPFLRGLIRDGYKAGQKSPQDKYETDLLSKSNHILGCELESYDNVLRYRGFDKEADMLMEVASRIK